MMNQTLMPPKKSWGQHFLIDSNIARKIVDPSFVSAGDHVVEIVPGRGILTEILLKMGTRVLAIEIDPRLSEMLRSAFSSYPNFELVIADACRYPYQDIKGPFKVISNLPYNISTPILFRLLEERDHLSGMILMVQKEVADRLTAPVGSKQYGALSVLFQALADVKTAFTVPPQCFRPRPDVLSAVIKVTTREPKVTLKEKRFFATVVKAAFSHRRKFLSNALTDAGFEGPILLDIFKDTGIDSRRRAETLLIEEFATLANKLYDQINYVTIK
jgi:16S rRNA (adenine1518-N6/adenine1519-N6)-dimethyltransferase